MTRGLRSARGDDGTVLLLALGLVVVVLMAVIVLINASAAFLQRRELLSLADAAALAGAQSVDVRAYYLTGATAATTLDPALVPRRVRAHLARFGSDLPPGMVVEEVLSDGRRVRVVLSAPLRLPFAEALFSDALIAMRITVASDAQLDYREKDR